MRTILRFVFIGVFFVLLALRLPARGEEATTPWLKYNAGVEAYAKGDYTNAFQAWQDLTLQPLPKSLKRPVWFQLGNVQFREGEPLETSAPEQTVELWRRSCDSYRSALLLQPRDPAARHNLDLVQARLARLLHRLGRESLQQAEGKLLDDAITLLQPALDNLEEATTLAPQDDAIRSDRDRASRALRERLLERAQDDEKKGDESATQGTRWFNRQAEDHYRDALDDLATARRRAATSPPPQEGVTPAQSDPLDQAAAQAEQRVSDKLSKLLTRMGQAEQKEGKQQEEMNPDEAFGAYERALEHFQAAQQVQPENGPARRGEREVRAAMEQLHVRQGREELARGKQALENQSPRAASALSSALGNFEAAMELNALNEEAKAGAEEARKLLPAALNLAGKAELKAGDRSEPESSSDALNHYQEAEKDYRQSLELQPGQGEAKKGMQEAEEKAARMREKVSKEAEQQAQQGSGKPPRSLQSLLGQVDETERQTNPNRQRQRGRKNLGEKKNELDW